MEEQGTTWRTTTFSVGGDGGDLRESKQINVKQEESRTEKEEKKLKMMRLQSGSKR